MSCLVQLTKFAYDAPGFIWKVTTHPDLICACGLKKIYEEMDHILLLENNGQIARLVFKLVPVEPQRQAHLLVQIQSYNTTFQLDFCAIFCLLLFEEKPSILVAFLLHKSKLPQRQEEVFRVIHEQIPSLLKQSTLPMVTDREKAIITAINKLPNNIYGSELIR